MPGTKKAVASEAASGVVRRRVHSDWESAVMRRVAPRVAELEEQAEREGSDQLYGWESVGLRHLSSHLSLKG